MVEQSEESRLAGDELRPSEKHEMEVSSLITALFKRGEWLLLIVALILLAGLAYSVRLIFSPILIYVVFLIATYPLRHESRVRHLILLATMIFGTWFCIEVSNAVLPFVVAFILSFIFTPVVDAFARHRIPRSVTIIGILLVLLGILVALSIFILPMILDQFKNFLLAIPTLTSELSNSLNSFVSRGILGFSPESQGLQQGVISEISSRIEDVTRAIPNGILDFVSQAVTASTKMLNLVLVPFLSFYIMKDYDLIRYRVKMLFPRRYRQRSSEIYSIVDRILGSYLRGALMIACINSIVISSLMFVSGVKYPLLIGLISGLLDMIPYFGIIVSMSVAVLIALFGDNPGFQIAMVLISFLGMNLTETAILYPKIIGSKIGVHPVLLILALLVFGYFLGFLGLLIAVPSTAILIGLRKYYEKNLRPAH